MAELAFSSSVQAELGDNYRLEGALEPKSADKLVVVKILRPDQLVVSKNLKTTQDGTFADEIDLSLAGNWIVTASC